MPFATDTIAVIALLLIFRLLRDTAIDAATPLRYAAR